MTPAHQKTKAVQLAFQLDCTTLSATALRKKYKPTYECWRAMRQRAKKFCIPVDQEFADFERFLSHLGPRKSPKYTVDRIDPKGPYSPTNCQWADKQQQALNKTNTVKLTYLGETLPLVAWAAKRGVSADTLYKRRQLGWSDQEIILGTRAAPAVSGEWPWPTRKSLEWEAHYQEKRRQGEPRESFYYRRAKEHYQAMHQRIQPYAEDHEDVPPDLAERYEQAQRYFFDAREKLEQYLSRKKARDDGDDLFE